MITENGKGQIMSKIDIKEARWERRKLSDLTNWEHNPRSILKEDFNDLKGQIDELGVYKTLLVNQDNIVLGGNMRLQAFIQMFGADYEAMCGIVETDSIGKMLKYALSDNDNKGTTDDLKLSEVYALDPIETSLYKIQSNVLRPLESIINPPDPATLGGDGDADQSDMDESLQTYLGGNIKQIVLYYSNDSYATIIDKLKAIGDEMGLDNNTDVITKLIEERYEGIVSDQKAA